MAAKDLGVRKAAARALVLITDRTSSNASANQAFSEAIAARAGSAA